MGLLDNYPYGLLNQIRNATQNRSPYADPGTGDANSFPQWAPRQQQRAPLSFAGPDLTADIATSSPSWPRPTVPLPRPAEASGATNLSWLRADRSADVLRAQPPPPPVQNLTVQALRMKGVPEADITAATGNPELMKQLIVQHYGPGSAGAPILYRADANNPVQLKDPSGPFVGSGPQSGPSRPQGLPLIQRVGFECKGFPAGCQNGGNFGDTGRFRFDIGDLCRTCAIRYTGAENLPAAEQIEILTPFERK